MDTEIQDDLAQVMVLLVLDNNLNTNNHAIHSANQVGWHKTSPKICLLFSTFMKHYILKQIEQSQPGAGIQGHKFMYRLVASKLT